jgi:hypothetical protein
LKHLVDLANRSAVTFYALDPRGLNAGAYMWTAEDNLGVSAGAEQDRFGAPTSGEVLSDDRKSARLRAYEETQGGPDYLTEQTGGFFSLDLESGLRRVLEDQKGYYLIGYRPNPETFNPQRMQFHKIRVRVKRPDLRVRSRKGFYNFTNEELRSGPRTRDERLISALTSPFALNNLDVRLTSLFLNYEKAGSFMRSLLHLNPRDLTFTTEPNGERKAIIDVAALTFGEVGIADSFRATYTILISEPTYRAIMRQGLRYEVAVPVKKPGPYQLRIAVRDAATDRIGSAGQFIEVPNLEKGRLALSGLLLSSGDLDMTAVESAATNTSQHILAPDNKDQALQTPTDDNLDLSARRIPLGTPLDYGYVIYNAKVDRKSGRPQLVRYVRIFRDGKLVSATEPQPLGLVHQEDLKRILVTERLQLTGLTTGRYILQVVITDLLANQKHGMATQWIDFEAVQ